MQTVAQDVVTQTISIDTGSCGVPGGTAAPRSGSSVYDYPITDPDGVVTSGKSTFYYPISPVPVNSDVYTTTDSLGSTIVQTGTGAPISFVTDITTTDSLGSTTVETSTFASTPVSSVPGTDAGLIPSPSSAATGTASAPESPVSSAPQPTGSSSDASCPASDGQAYSVEADTYQITCGTDYPGNDLQTPHVADLAACLKACTDYIPDPTRQANAPCIAAAFGAGNVGGNCYLKYAITEVNVGNGGFSVGRNIDYKIPAAATSESLVQYPSSTSSSATVSGTSSPATTGDPCAGGSGATGVQATTNNTQTYSISCRALFDSDLLATVDASTFQACLSLCDNYDGCVAVSFQNTLTTANCQLLSAISEIIYGDIDFNSGYRTNYTLSSDVIYVTISGSATITVTPTTSSFPTVGGLSSSTIPDLLSVTAASPSLAPAHASSAAVAASSSSVLDEASSLASIATASSGTVELSLTISGGSSLAVVGSPSLTAPEGSSTTGEGLPSLTAPGASSSAAIGSPSSTAAATSSPAAIESSMASATPATSTVASDSSPTTTGGDTEPTVQNPEPDCQASPQVGNGTKYNDEFAYTYDIRCALGVEGQNADRDAHADTFPRCLEYCSLLEGCVAVTYLDGNNEANDNSNCYPYYSFTGYSTGGPSQVYSGVMVDGASPGAVGNNDLCGAQSNILNNGIFEDAFSNCYAIGCGQYISYRTELFATDMATLEACATYCSLYNGCIAVDWTGPHTIGNHDDANCIPIAATDMISSSVPASTQYALATGCPS